MAEEKQALVDLELGNQSANEPDTLLEDPEIGRNLTNSMNNEPDQTVSEPGSSVDRNNNVWIKPDQSWSEIPGLWSSSVNTEYCYIYRVPNVLRRVNPEAYTPQMLLIGPLHHSKKAEAVKLYKTDSRYLDYINMEQQKKKYVKEIAFGNQTIKEFRRIIKRNEEIIRASYAESTECIKSEEFIEMILQDSVFILIFITSLRNLIRNEDGDNIFSKPFFPTIILQDLILLENQLPYFLLEQLFEPFYLKSNYKETFRDSIIDVFGFEGKIVIKKDVKFKHFTDLCRLFRVQTLDQRELLLQEYNVKLGMENSIKNLHNANKLYSSGVKFAKIDETEDLSLVISFKDGILKLPSFTADHTTERVLRNIMVLEQCHYLDEAFVCNYIIFLDFLIDTEEDVKLLVKEGIIKNGLGSQEAVAGMVNKLCIEIFDWGSNYYKTVEKLNTYYKDHVSWSITKLKRVYFKDLWTGTATVAAVVILLLTLIQTVISALELTGDSNKSPAPAPNK